MEGGSESDAVFESLNLNPRLLVNEVLNTVENLLDEAFDYYHQEASTLVNTQDTDRSEHLSQGIDKIRNVIQHNVGIRLGMWQEFCSRHCFALPQGFSLPKNESLDERLASQDVLCHPDLDAQLGSLRDRLNLIGKETTQMNRELQALERQSTLSDSRTALANEALQFYEKSFVDDMFQELVKTASELRTKIEKLRTRRIEDSDCSRTKRICDPKIDLSSLNHGLFSAKLEDLQEFVAVLKKL
ncbi:protein MIS12 homolog isoform X1 [Ricinus communis]|uniref:protein MIS12 homolog isoform X1 n=1 Tax=Ricinus communis TaxID=3988 RepID=UPI00201AFCE4|nr:protein MIS12 homolog isoform X1 [Ricinus communis]